MLLIGKFKLLPILAILTLVISVQVAFKSIISKAEENDNNVQTNEREKNYFLIGKNYFEDPTIDKGELDAVIGGGKMTKSRDQDGPDSELTYNEFYMKYNFSPEMSNIISNRYGENPYNYLRAAERGNSTIILKKFDSHANLITTPDPYTEYETTPADKIFRVTENVPQVPDSFGAQTGTYPIKPLFFSYLYVGDGVSGQNNNYQYNTNILFPDTIGYNETNKVSDYLLSDKNNFVIPTRYNAARDDITLLMRSKTEHNTNTPNVYLDVLDEDNNPVVGKATNSKYYIDTKVSLHLTEYSYNRLSDEGMNGYRSLDPANNIAPAFNNKINGMEIAANKFTSEMNTLLRAVKTKSREGIVMGVGGSVNLNGFYRNGLEEFTATTSERMDDKEKTTKVKFYMLQTETNPRSGLTVVKARAWGDAALNDEIDGVKNVLTPEISKFALNTTRPTITMEKAVDFNFDPEVNDFDDLLGEDSIKIEDEGVSMFADASGKPQTVEVDNENLRVRVKEATAEEWLPAMTLAQLKTSIGDYAGKTLDIAYVYSATDAEADNVGLLPEEIKDNTGAYAIPLLKQVKVAAAKEITVQYLIEGEDNEPALFSETKEGKLGDPFTHTAPATYEKDGVEYELVTEENSVSEVYKETPQTFKFYYKEIKYSDFNISYVVEGDEEGTPLFTDKKTDKVGEPFTHTAPATYEKDGVEYELVTTPAKVDGTYAASNQPVIFVYKVKEAPETQAEVNISYVVEGDEEGSPLFTDKLTGTVGEPFTHTAPATYEKDGVIYELVTTPAKVDGTYAASNQPVIFVYKPRTTPEVKEEGTVTVRYVDEAGNVLATKEQLTGNVGETYQTSAVAVYMKDGKYYQRIEVPNNSKGEYKLGNINVDYVYRPYGSVTVTYKTKDGTELKKNEILSGAIKSKYTTTKYDTLTVDGKTYKLVATPTNASGEYTGKDIVVNYVYELQTAEKGNVIVRHVDKDGKVLQKLPTKTGELKAKYTTTAPKEIKVDGVVYKLVTSKNPTNATGVYTKDDIFVDYVYEKKVGTTDTGTNDGKDTPSTDDEEIPVPKDKDDATTDTGKEDKATLDDSKNDATVTTDNGETPASNSGLNVEEVTPVVDNTSSDEVSDLSGTWTTPTSGSNTSNKTSNSKNVSTTTDDTNAVNKTAMLPQTGADDGLQKYLSAFGALILLASLFIFRRRM
ncbi:MAG: MucBP domain-containing protein [Kurthia sp.]|nr:MucBP domain-containing protein [Candidatus Kurthia equi]